MAEREQVRKPTPVERESETTQAPAASERGKEIKAELDDLLDEILHALRTGQLRRVVGNRTATDNIQIRDFGVVNDLVNAVDLAKQIRR